MAQNPRQPLIRVIRPAVWAVADDRIRDVARRLGSDDQSCVLVVCGHELGIVTDHDFRRLVATGEVSVEAPLATLASAPVLTIDEGTTAAAALLRMVEHGVHHLVVLGAAGAAVGVVRAVDLAKFEVRDPLLARAAIGRAATADELAMAGRSVLTTVTELRANGWPAAQAGAMHTALVDAVLRRALTLRGDPALAGVSWLLLGSFARREPLPTSDLDTALLWPDRASSTPDSEPDRAIRAAATKVLEDLRRCGLMPCPNGANADNPLFSRSQSAWAAAAQNWVRESVDGALLLSAMVTDSRPVTEVALGKHLTDALMAHTRTSQFLRALLDEAVRWRPSTGHLRDFVVQRSGPNKGRLDLKRGGLVPVVALGRWIAIVTGDPGGSTAERLDRGVRMGLITDDERHTLAVGFESVYTLLYDLEVRALRSEAAPSTFVRPRDLDSLTRRHLRETLRAVSTVQRRVDESWIRRLDR
jgi:CBS domain-containing protein